MGVAKNKACEGTIWVIEVEWKRRKGKPVEAVAITTGGILSAMCLATECAQRLKVPQSWTNMVLYRRCARQAKTGEQGRRDGGNMESMAQLSEATLKRCPFCGRHSYLVPLHPGSENTHWQVECAASLCPAHPCVEAATRAKAIAGWNRRTGELRSENCALRTTN